MRALIAKTLALFGRERLDDEFSEEIETHIALMTEENVRRGMSAEQARTAALRDFGGVTQTQEKVRTQRGFPLLESIVQDVGFALRQLKKSPEFTVTAVLTLTLGIGANLAVFGLLYALVLRSLPVPHPGDLINVYMHVYDTKFPDSYGTMPWGIFDELQQRQQSTTELAALLYEHVSLKDEEGILRSEFAAFASGNAFQALRVKPARGRLLVPADDIPTGPAGGWPVVLSYNTWKDRFHFSPKIVGTQLTIANTPVTVVGVLPRDFLGVEAGTEPTIYLPMQFAQLGLPKWWKANWDCMVFARLRPGTDLRQVNAELESLRNTVFDAGFPPEIRRNPMMEHVGLYALPGRRGFSVASDDMKQSLLQLEGLVILVLLLCCVNVGGLIMARNQARRQEFGVRAALGAGRSRLVRQCLTEGFVLGAAGSALGALLAWSISDTLLEYLSQDYVTVRHDFSFAAFSAIAAIVTTLLFAIFPALFAGHSSPAAVFSLRGQSSIRRRILAKSFVPLQIGLSLMLVVVAGLISHSLYRVLREPRGFNVKHVVMLWAGFSKLPTKGLRDRFQQMVVRLETMPGVDSASLTFFTPLWHHTKAGMHVAAVVDGPQAREDKRMTFNVVSPDYFKTMQIGLLAGREFEWSERDFTVCILNRSAATFLFPRRDPIGLYVRRIDEASDQPPHDDVCRVVGLVDDAKYSSLKEAAPATIYFPISDLALKWAGNGLEFMMRSSNDELAAQAYKKVWSELASDTAFGTPVTLEWQMKGSIGRDRLMSLLSLSFAALALLLSAIGLYGLLSTNVTQRTGEIGIRLAMGASRRTVLMMVLRDAGYLVVPGVAIGSVGAVFAVRAIKAMLYNTSPFDPVALIVSSVLLAGVALLAAYIPARRAASIEPMDALRAE